MISFLLSIPAIIGALLLSILSGHAEGSIPISIILIGLTTSMIVGYAALSLLVRLVRKGNLYFFAPYCAAVGILALIAGS